MHQRFKTKTSITKKVVSWTLGVPAALFAVSEVQDLNFWWVPFVAMGAVILVLRWNHAFDNKEEYQPKFANRRRSF